MNRPSAFFPAAAMAMCCPRPARGQETFDLLVRNARVVDPVERSAKGAA